MKVWIMVAVLAGLVVFAGIALIIGSQSVVADGVPAESGSCAYGSEGCPYKGTGGCSEGSNCGQNTCAAKYGGGCGCGGR